MEEVADAAELAEVVDDNVVLDTEVVGDDFVVLVVVEGSMS